MPSTSSIIPGYEYDIFISYRQNDNRSGWVTEFVHHLNEELAATIKEAVSVYFDSNPHDGLLETHDVDESLKSKLKCLIFIPIISQTYCDPKSFAWKNEFLAFKKLAREDQLGLKIKLHNGNVASRILPVRIHELDDNDKATLESEMGPLRSVDFIFKSAGVNRPLRAKDDEIKEIAHSAFYRDQINKTANAVKDIITALQYHSPRQNEQPPANEPLLPPYAKKVATLAGALLLFGIATFSLFYFGGGKSKIKELEQPNSIAVLPFDNLSNDPDQEYFCDGTTEQVISSLARVKDLKVIARTSVLQYKRTKKTIAQIGKELNVTHVLESSVRKSGNQLRITAQLIAVADESHLWAEDFDNRLVTDIFQIQDEVAAKIASSLKNELLPGDREKLKSEKPANPEAYEHYLKGEYIHGNYYLSKFLREDFDKAEAEFKKAIQLDSNYATAWAALSNLYDSRSNFASAENERLEYRARSTPAAHKAFKLNPKLTYALLVEAQYWFHRKQSPATTDSTFKYFRRAYETSPNSGLICSEFSGFYASLGLYRESLALAQRALEIDPTRAYRFLGVGLVNFFLHDFAAAEKNLNKALSLEPNNFLVTDRLFQVKCKTWDLKKAEQLLSQLKRINPDRDISISEAIFLAEKGEKENALNKSKSALVYAILKMEPETLKQLEVEQLNYLDFGDPDLDFLKRNEQFVKMVENAKVEYEKRRKRYGKIDLPN